MAVTGLGCNRPLWRFHRGPDPLPSLLYAHIQPRRAPGVPFSGDSIPQPYKQNPAAGETGGGAKSVCFCHSRVCQCLSGGFTMSPCPFHGRWKIRRVSRLMATASRDDRRCAYPLGCGFCGSPKRVERAENAPLWARTHIVGRREERPRRTVPRTRPWRRAVAKAGMQSAVVWTPRAPAAWPKRRRGGDKTGRPGKARTVQVNRTGYCALSLSHMATEVVLQCYLYRHEPDTAVAIQSIT